MPDTKVGRIVHISRGYTVAEIVEPSAGGDKVVGFSVFGHRSDTGKLFGSQQEAIKELGDLANAGDADWQATQRNHAPAHR